MNYSLTQETSSCHARPKNNSRRDSSFPDLTAVDKLAGKFSMVEFLKAMKAVIDSEIERYEKSLTIEENKSLNKIFFPLNK